MGIIVVLSVLLALSWGKKPVVVDNSTHTTDTVKVTINNHDTIYVPKPFRIVHEIVKRTTDTIYVYNDYYNTVEYRDTIRDKNSASYVYLHDEVTQNRLKRRYVDFYSSHITQEKTRIITAYQEKPHLYFGVTGTTGLDMYLDLTYKTPNKGMYSIGIDPIKEIFIGGVKFKIF